LGYEEYAEMCRLSGSDLSQTVTFTYRDYRRGSKLKELTLCALEFIGRFGLHILPDVIGQEIYVLRSLQVACPEQGTALTSLRSQKSWIDHQRSLDDLYRPAQRQFQTAHSRRLSRARGVSQALFGTVPAGFPT
jgi:Putative transposase